MKTAASILLAVGALAASGLAAEKAPRRGGYGTEPAAPPNPPAAPADDWIAGAESRLVAAIAAVNRSAAPANKTWSDLGRRLESQRNALLQSAGFGPDDLARYTTPLDGTAEGFAQLVQRFHEAPLEVLLRLDLRRIGNPPDPIRNEPLHPAGNRAAVGQLLATLDDDLALFRSYEAIFARHLAARIDQEAELIALRARQARLADQAATAVPSRLHALRVEEDRLRTQETVRRGLIRAGATPDRIAAYRFFGRTDLLARALDHPVPRRTDGLVPRAEAARRLEAHVATIGEHVTRLLAREELQAWNIDPSPWLDLHRREAQSIEGMIARVLAREGASSEELNALERQMTAFAAAEPAFGKDLSECADFARRESELDRQIDEVEIAIDRIVQSARRLSQAGKHAEARAVDDTAAPLRARLRDLTATRTQLDRESRASAARMVAQVDALQFAKPPRGARVRAVRLEVADEAQPTKRAVPTQPLKGAPVEMNARQRFTDLALGVPTIAVIDVEPEPGAASATELPLQLTVGGRTVNVIARRDPDREQYRSAPFLLVPPASPAVVP